jgi:hypothetical protein
MRLQNSPVERHPIPLNLKLSQLLLGIFRLLILELLECGGGLLSPTQLEL